jgi:hypothetical protein
MQTMCNGNVGPPRITLEAEGKMTERKCSLLRSAIEMKEKAKRKITYRMI